MAQPTQLALLKPCSVCGEWLSLADFYTEPRSPTGYRANCKACHRAKVNARAADPVTRAAIAAYQAAYREQHREKARATTARYRAEFPDRVALAQQRYRSDSANQATARARARAFRLANPARRSEYDRRRRAWKTSMVVGFITPATLGARMSYWGNRCWMCGSTRDLQVDHVKPLAKGGAHMLANLRPACAPCNRSKADRWPLPELGGLRCSPSPCRDRTTSAASPRRSAVAREPSAGS